MGDNCDVFCREQDSADFCHTHATGARIHVCHDMAFYWSPSCNARTTRSFYLKALSNSRYAKFAAKQAFKGLLYAGRITDGRLLAFRDDAERTLAIPHNNVDVSAIYASMACRVPFYDRWLAAAAANSLAAFLGLASEIHTNRLHIAILGTILGKSVSMFDNSYGKNRAVYEYSMRNAFSNVDFLASEVRLPARQAPRRLRAFRPT